MITHGPVGADIQAGRRPVTLLAWCAAASLGLLFVKANNQLGALQVITLQPTPVLSDWVLYAPLAAPVVALVVWHLAPRASWPWLLAAGAVFTLPGTVFTLSADVMVPLWMWNVVPILTTSAPVFTLVGVLGAATTIWREGAPGVGSTLVGTALVVQVVGPVVLASLLGVGGMIFPTMTTTIVTLVLTAVALIGAVAAAVRLIRTSTGTPPARPGWRVTAPACVVAVSPLVAYLWAPQVEGQVGGTGLVMDGGTSYLILALVFAGIGVLGGIVAGAQVLLGAAGAGLLLGVLGMLITPSAQVLHQMAILAAVAAGISLAAGAAVALTRWRLQAGMGGLVVVALGLMVLGILFNTADSFASYETFVMVATPVLLVIGVVAAVAALSAVADAHAPRAETPPLFAGLTTAFSLAAIAAISYVTVDVPVDKPPLAGLLPAGAVLLLVAVALLGGLTVLHRRTPPPVSPAPPWASPTPAADRSGVPPAYGQGRPPL